MGELQARSSRSSRRRYARSSAAGGSCVDGCGTAAQPALRRCLRLLRRAVCCSRRWRKTRLVAHQGLMHWRDVRRMRPGGQGACVTTLLEMPFGAQRQNFCDAMRDLVVSPAMGVSTFGARCGVGARIAPPFMEATDASRLVCVVVVSCQEYSLTHASPNSHSWVTTVHWMSGCEQRRVC